MPTYNIDFRSAAVNEVRLIGLRAAERMLRVPRQTLLNWREKRTHNGKGPGRPRKEQQQQQQKQQQQQQWPIIIALCIALLFLTTFSGTYLLCDRFCMYIYVDLCFKL